MTTAIEKTLEHVKLIVRMITGKNSPSRKCNSCAMCKCLTLNTKIY